jgi:hypothetical protein
MTRRNTEIMVVISMALLGLFLFHCLWNIQVWFIEHPLKMPVITIREVQ